MDLSLDLWPCAFFLWGSIKNLLSVPPSSQGWGNERRHLDCRFNHQQRWAPTELNPTPVRWKVVHESWSLGFLKTKCPSFSPFHCKGSGKGPGRVRPQAWCVSCDNRLVLNLCTSNLVLSSKSWKCVEMTNALLKITILTNNILFKLMLWRIVGEFQSLTI